MLVEMELREIQFFDVEVPWQRVLLQEKDGPREFPIYIGDNEAAFLEMAVKHKGIARPLTHDLITNLIRDLGGELLRVLVDDLREETFFGKLVIRAGDGREVLVDSRPSDAIILAVKSSAPIFVEDHVLWEVSQGGQSEQSSDGDDE
jgi:bifunctional DNase/RNase